MPKLWNDTVQEHRDAVREAVLDGVARLMKEGGVSSVSMTNAAAGAGISRATLYKYFPDVQALLSAWHERQVGEHLGHLHRVRDQAGRHSPDTGREDHHGVDPMTAVRAVLEEYAVMLQQSSMESASAYLHAGSHADRAQAHLHEFLSELIGEAITSAGGRDGTTDSVRTDVPVDDLASFALHAVNAAAASRSPEAARLLVGVIVDGLSHHPNHSHDLDPLRS